MATSPPAGETPSKDRSSGFFGKLAKIVGGILAALVLLIAVIIVFAIPVELNWVKGEIEIAATEALGRPFAIEGPLSVILSIPPAAEIEGVRIGNPSGWPEGDLATLKQARARLQILPLLQGKIVIEEIAVDGLHLDLVTNADGDPNWLLRDPAAEPTEEETPEPDTEPKALAFVELAELNLTDIVLLHHDAATGKDFELALDEITGSAEDREPMSLLIRGTVQDKPYEIQFGAGSLVQLTTGTAPWPMDLRTEVLGSTLTVDGEIAEPLRGRGLALDFTFQGPSMKDLEILLETRLPPIDSFRLTGRIEEEGGRYRLADLAGEVAGTGVTGRFEAETSGDKPRLLGEIDIRVIDAGPLNAAIGAERTRRAGDTPDAEQAETETVEEPVNGSLETKVDLDAPVLALDVLEKFDADFELRIHEVANAPMELRDASLAVTVSEGRLSAPLAVTFAQVPFEGELSLARENGEPKIDLSLTSKESDIGELAHWLMEIEGVEGGFELLHLAFASGGETLRSLIESAELTLDLSDAALSYGHEAGGKPVEFTLSAASIVLPATNDARIEAAGTLLGEAFTVEFSGGTLIGNLVRRVVPAKIRFTGGGAELLVDGLIQKASDDDGTRIDFSFSGDRLGGLAAWLGVSPDAPQAYALKGRVEHRLERLQIGVADASIGNTSFSGAAGLYKGDEKPITFAKLDFQTLDLKGFAGIFPESDDESKGMDEERDMSAEALRIDVPILPKGIELFDSDIDIGIAEINMDAADIRDVSLSAKIRDGHVRQVPIGAQAAGTRFDGAFSIDLRTEVPLIGLEVSSSKADVGAMLAQFGVTEGLTVTAGGLDLAMQIEGATTRAMLENSTLSVDITDGAWDFRAPGAKNTLPIRVPEARLEAKPEAPITLAIDGRIEDTPIRIRLTTDTLGSFAEPKEELSLEMAIELVEAKLALTGTAPLPAQGENLHFTMHFQGRRLSDFDQLLDVDLPEVGPYSLTGGFGTQATGLYVQDLTLTVGESILTGKLDFTTAVEPPRLDVALVAERIQLDDFVTEEETAASEETESAAAAEAETAEAAEPKPGEESAGGRPLLSPEVMRALDAVVDVRVEQVLSGKDELGNGVLTARLENGRLTVEPLTLDLPGGSANLTFALDPDSQGIGLETRADIERLDYGILARRIDPASTTGGIISLDLDLATRGPDLARVMEGANGHLDFGLWPEDLNAGLFELWAVNVITTLMKEVDKEEASKVNCVIVRFKADDGVLQHRIVYADTTKMRVEGEARVDFKARDLDVKAAPTAKRPEFFSLAVPVGLSGEFDDFGLDINPLVLTGKAVSFITSPLHVPVRRIFREKEPADGEAACAQVWSVADPENLPDVPGTEPPAAADEAPEDDEPAIDVLDLDL
jgi:uncharacterized protein involved in outer membrane biogenesis